MTGEDHILTPEERAEWDILSRSKKLPETPSVWPPAEPEIIYITEMGAEYHKYRPRGNHSHSARYGLLHVPPYRIVMNFNAASCIVKGPDGAISQIAMEGANWPDREEFIKDKLTKPGKKIIHWYNENDPKDKPAVAHFEHCYKRWIRFCVRGMIK